MRNAVVPGRASLTGRIKLFWVDDTLAATFVAIALFVTGLWLSPHDGALAEVGVGLWSWYDQSEYLRTYHALFSGDFRSVNFSYPPLYAMLAAVAGILHRPSGFLLANFVFFWIYVSLLIGLASSRLGRLSGRVAVLLGFGLFYTATLEQWVIPWTTSLAFALIAIVGLVALRIERDPSRLAGHEGRMMLLLAGFAYGALFSARPSEFAAFLPLPVYVAFQCLKSSLPLLRRLGLLAMAVIGGFVALALGASFNVAIHGDVLGRWFANNAGNGFVAESLVSKIVLLWINAGTVFDGVQSITDRYPYWPALLVGAFYAVLFWNGLLSVLILCAVCQVLLYAPYTDLTPIGIFRFYNIHYFKWLFPIVTIAFVSMVADLRTSHFALRKSVPALALVICALFAGNTAMALSDPRLVRDRRDPDRRLVEMRWDGTSRIDAIDLAEVSGTEAALWWGEHVINADGRRLRHIVDFRAFAIPGGTRILFTRPQRISTAVLRFGSGVTVGRSSQSRAYALRVALGCRLLDCTYAAPAPPIERLANLSARLTLDVARPPADAVFSSGWDHPVESWGRWASSTEASVVFRAPEGGYERAEVSLTPLLRDRADALEVALLVNDCLVGRATLTLESGRLIEAEVPPSCRLDRDVRVTLRASRTARPRDLNVNQDTRELGIGLRAISLF